MGKRTWIDSELWSDTDDLNSDEKLFYLYLLTNDQRNIAGYYRIHTRYVSVDMGWSKTQIERMLNKKQKYWMYDKTTGQVLIPKFTRYNIVRSKQQFTALNAELNKLKPCPLHKEFLKGFEEVNGLGSTQMIDAKFREKAEDILL